MRMTGTAPRARAGFTLVEMAVSIAVLMILLGSLAGILFRSESFLSLQTKEYDMEDAGRRALTALNEQIRSAFSDSIQPAVLANSNSIQFQRVVGFDAGVEQLGPTVIIAKQLAAGEIANGVDDNGDGRSDEGALLYTDDSGVSRFIAADVLDVRFNNIARGVACTVTIGKLSREGQLLQQQFTQSIHVRN